MKNIEDRSRHKNRQVGSSRFEQGMTLEEHRAMAAGTGRRPLTDKHMQRQATATQGAWPGRAGRVLPKRAGHRNE